MAKLLRLLLIEDSEDDALLVVRELRRGGYEVSWQRVDTAAALADALQHPWDAITCDWVMPQFSAPAALALLQERGVELPIVIVSGEVGEEVAVTAMRAGAHDFVGKRRLTRLVPAIERELRDAEERRGRKRAEQELRESAAELRRLTASISDFLWSADLAADGRLRYRYYTPAVERITGRPSEFFVVGPKRWLSIIHPQDRPPLEAALQRIVTGQSDHEEQQYRVVRPDGTVRWVRDSAMVTRFPDGRVRLDGVGTDITERKQAEEALRTAQARLDLALAGSNAGVWEWDLATDTTEYSQRWRDLLGYAADDFSRTADWIMLVHPDDRGRLAAAVREYISNPSSRYEIEFRIRHKDGSYRWFLSRATAIFDAAGTLLRLLGMHVDITERKRMEEAQRQSDARYRFLADNAGDLLVRADQNGIILDISAASRTVLGYERQELIGRSLFDYIHPDDLGPTVERYAEAVDRLAAVTHHCRVRRKDGTYGWIEGSARAVASDAAAGTEVVVVARDVTERKRAEEKFRVLLEAAPDAMVIVDRHGLIGLVNSQTEELFGYTRADLLGEAVEMLIPDRFHAQHVEHRTGYFQESASRPMGVGLELYGRRKDGTEFPVEISLSPSATDEDVLVIASIRDITDRKRADAVIRGYTQRLQCLWEIDRAILALDSPEQIAGAAISRLRQMVGCERGSVTLFHPESDRATLLAIDGTDVSDLPPGRVLSSADYGSLDGLRRGEALVVNDLLTLDAPPRWAPAVIAAGLRSLISVPMIAQGELIGSVNLVAARVHAFDAERRGVVREVANQLAVAIRQAHLHDEVQQHAKELEQRVRERTAQLEAANQELEAFSYSVSHDLRAPLRRIEGFGRALVEEHDAQLDTAGRHYLQRIQEGTRYMGQLISALLALSQVQRNHLCRASVDLSALVQAIAADLRHTAPARMVEFVIAEGVVVEGDPGLLRTVLENLLGNAWKYTGKHPLAHIEFGVTDQDGRRVYFVRDDGAGFDMADAGKLFCAFQRLHGTEEFEGTGIGLAMVARIIRRHGGDVWAEGTVERGATFYFTLRDGAASTP